MKTNFLPICAILLATLVWVQLKLTTGDKLAVLDKRITEAEARTKLLEDFLVANDLKKSQQFKAFCKGYVVRNPGVFPDCVMIDWGNVNSRTSEVNIIGGAAAHRLSQDKRACKAYQLKEDVKIAGCD